MSNPDFFRSRLDAMVDPRHPLAVLADRLDWAQIEARLGPLFARDDTRPVAEGLDLFGPTPTQVTVHAGGRLRLPFRLMVSLMYLKHAYGESDESVCERWSENVVWQFFVGPAKLIRPVRLLSLALLDDPHRSARTTRPRRPTTVRTAGAAMPTTAGAVLRPPRSR